MHHDCVTILQSRCVPIEDSVIRRYSIAFCVDDGCGPFALPGGSCPERVSFLRAYKRHNSDLVGSV